MHKQRNNAVVLFPGALGDFVCFLPTLLGLRERHPDGVLLVTLPAHLNLLRLPDLDGASIHRREVSDLFAPRGEVAAHTRALFSGYAFAYSWTGASDPHMPARLAEATGITPRMYAFRDMLPGEHATEYYARCAGVRTRALPADLICREEAWGRSFLQSRGLRPQAFLVVHPGSGAQRKNWQGFAELLRAYRRARGEEIVVLAGPADDRAAANLDAAVVHGLSLPRVAALLSAALGYVGNDSGISHLAAALRTCGVALFGPSDPALWAPRGGRVRVCHAPRPCAACGPEIFCTHRLPVSAVMARLQQTLDAETANSNP